MTQYSEKTGTYSNNATSNRVVRIAVPAAIAGGIVLIIYFLIVKAMGYYLQTNLRWINYILMIPVSIYAVQKYISTTSGKTYLEALWISIIAYGGAYFVLGLFMFVYLSIDVQFMNHLHQLALPELQLNPIGILMLLVGEGVIGGAVISFIVLQFFKDQIRNVA